MNTTREFSKEELAEVRSRCALRDDDPRRLVVELERKVTQWTRIAIISLGAWLLIVAAMNAVILIGG